MTTANHSINQVNTIDSKSEDSLNSIVDLLKNNSYLMKYNNIPNVNLHELNERTKIRMFKDISTDVFTLYIKDKMLNQDIFTFVGFLYNFVFNKLQLELNETLYEIINLNEDNSPLNKFIENDEEVKFYFKGGTLLNLYKNILLNKLNKTDSDFDNELFPNDPKDSTPVTKYFKISDTDMAIMINTKYNKRYELLKYTCLIILGKAFDEIKDIFNKLYTYNVNNNVRNDNDLLNTLIRGHQSIFDKDSNGAIKKLINFDITNITNIESLNSILSLSQIKSQILNILLKSKNVQICDSFLYLVCNKIRATSPNANIPANNKLITNDIILNAQIIYIIKNMIIIERELLSTNKIYTKYNSYINDLINVNKYLMYLKLYTVKDLFTNYDEFTNNVNANIEKEINDLKQSNKDIWDYDTSPPTKYKINNDAFYVPSNNIKYGKGRKDFALVNNDKISNQSLLINIGNDANAINNIHYTSYNNTISVYLDKAKRFNLFSLIRIKHNITINNLLINDDTNKIVKKLFIPSELLDISISHNKQDGNYEYISSKSHTNKSLYIKNNTYKIQNTAGQTEIISNSILCMNNLVIFNDLNNMLFKQTTCFPWQTDIKYKKRLFRLLFIFNYNYQEKIDKYNLTAQKDNQVTDNINNNILIFIAAALKSITFNGNNISNYDENLFNKFFMSNITDKEIKFIADNKNPLKNPFEIFNIKPEFFDFVELIKLVSISLRVLKDNKIALSYVNISNAHYNVIDNMTDVAKVNAYKDKFKEFIDITNKYLEVILTGIYGDDNYINAIRNPNNHTVNPNIM